jgi:hypothetical protein
MDNTNRPHPLTAPHVTPRPSFLHPPSVDRSHCSSLGHCLYIAALFPSRSRHTHKEPERCANSIMIDSSEQMQANPLAAAAAAR